MDDKKKMLCAMIANEIMADDDFLDGAIIFHALELTFNPAVLTKDRIKHFRSGQIFRLQPEQWLKNYIDVDFHQRFRMRKDSYMELVEIIRPFFPVKCTRGDAPLVPPEKALIMTLWYLGHQASMDDCGDYFGVAASTVCKEVHKVVKILGDCSSRFIVWPKENECEIVRRQFRDLAGYPGTIGAIDGCHIEVLAPVADQDSYTDRKMNHSIILQGICTAKKIFTNVSIGLPGSRNDCRALAYSSMYRTVTSQGPNSMFYNEENHLVGDKAYPCRSWLLSPYKDYGNLTPQQRRHNYIHSSTRIVIEHTFGLLKGRWRHLLCYNLKDFGRATDFVLAFCVLHIFCYLNNDNVINDIVEDVNRYQGNGGGYVDAASKVAGEQKRDRIAAML